MKKTGIINSNLSYVVARMGHTDKLVVCDSGLPIPRSATVVDLALTRNIPRLTEVLAALMADAKFEAAIVAAEMETSNSQLFKTLKTMLEGIPVRTVPHEEFKKMTCQDEAHTSFVRTGEVTPFANVILISGVTFC